MQQPTYQRPVYEHRIIQCKQVKVKVPPRVEAHRAALIVSVALSRHEINLQDPGYGASASCGMPVYLPAFAGTKLYCLVTEAVGCEQLA